MASKVVEDKPERGVAFPLLPSIGDFDLLYDCSLRCLFHRDNVLQ